MLPDELPLARVRDDDVIIAYVLRPPIIAPEVIDRLDAEPADSDQPGDFREVVNADGEKSVRDNKTPAEFTQRADANTFEFNSLISRDCRVVALSA